MTKRYTTNSDDTTYTITAEITICNNALGTKRYAEYLRLHASDEVGAMRDYIGQALGAGLAQFAEDEGIVTDDWDAAKIEIL